MLKLAFLVLSLNPEGELRMTLSERDTIEACQETVNQIAPTLKKAGYTVLTLRCDETDLRLTPYGEVAKDDPLHLYKVQLVGVNDFIVAPLMEGESCTASPNGRDPVFCALSAQKVIPDTAPIAAPATE